MSNTNGMTVGSDVGVLGTASNAIQSVVNGIGFYFVALMRSVKAAKEFEKLASVSDSALAAKGVSREKLTKDIVASYLTF